MNYTQVVQTALGYADSEDVEVNANVDMFLRIVESRINARLDVQEMAVRTQLPTTEGKEYYGLPSDFKSLRDIRYKASNAPGEVTLEYLNPMQGNTAGQSDLLASCYYTILADQLKIIPAPMVGTLEIVYHRKLPPLVETGDGASNWLSDGNPDIYVFGMLVEISSFRKDAVAADLWDKRFNDSMTLLSDDDSSSRWSGTPLRVRLG